MRTERRSSKSRSAWNIHRLRCSTGDSVFVRRTKAGQLRRPSWLDREEALETFNADVWLGAVVKQSPIVMVRVIAENSEVPSNMEVMLVGKHMNHMSIKLAPDQFQVTRVPVDEPFVVAIMQTGTAQRGAVRASSPRVPRGQSSSPCARKRNDRFRSRQSACRDRPSSP